MSVLYYIIYTLRHSHDHVYSLVFGADGVILILFTDGWVGAWWEVRYALVKSILSVQIVSIQLPIGYTLINQNGGKVGLSIVQKKYPD